MTLVEAEPLAAPDPGADPVNDTVDALSAETPLPDDLLAPGPDDVPAEDGSPRCVACLMCSTACPAQCIYIKPAEYPEGDARRGYERYPEEFVIDDLTPEEGEAFLEAVRS